MLPPLWTHHYFRQAEPLRHVVPYSPGIFTEESCLLACASRASQGKKIQVSHVESTVQISLFDAPTQTILRASTGLQTTINFSSSQLLLDLQQMLSSS